MINPNVIYKVTGRYMEGTKIVAYHLVGTDNSQAKESRERIIWLIGKGLISNMRIQLDVNKEIMLRGKGVNLNQLPVYDEAKQQFRKNDISQEVAKTKVSVDKSNIDSVNPMGQYKIIRRIMYKNKCLGYEVQDYSGEITRKKRDTIKELAIQKLISNAVAQKYKRPDSDNIEIIIRGVGCDLGKLPILIVNEHGKIIDPKEQDNNVTVRGAYMKYSGVIHDQINNKNIHFKSGDFIICGINGEIKIKNRLEVEGEYTSDKESLSATCDDYLYITNNFCIEIFGNKPITLNEKIVKAWGIMKPKKVS